jgi:fructose-bisphosphate aldolase, class II
MTLLTLKEILTPTIRKGWAIGAYDSPNLAVSLGILDAAEEEKAPVILMIYPGMISPRYYATYIAPVLKEIELRNVAVAIVLDHGPSLLEIGPALEAGFTGVMIDASKYPFEQNVSLTKQVVEMAHKVGISVEAELGHVGMGVDVVPEEEMKALYTRVDEAADFVAQTGVDALAVAIGTAHGIYKYEPRLDFERLEALRNSLDLPLVLHGSSGTPDAQLVKAVELGINKVNVYTDIRMAVLEKMQLKAAQPIESIDIPDFDQIQRLETKRVVQEKNALFKAVGKAGLYR